MEKTILKKAVKYLKKNNKTSGYRIIKKGDREFIQEAMFTETYIEPLKFRDKIRYDLVSGDYFIARGDYNYQPFWISTNIELSLDEKEELREGIKWEKLPENEYKWSDFLAINRSSENDIVLSGDGYSGSDYTDDLDDYGTKACHNFMEFLQKEFPKYRVDCLEYSIYFI